MPIDPTLVPALERELEQAKKTKGGGQPPRPERIAAIEAAIKLHKKAAKETTAAEKAEPADKPTKRETADAQPASENTAA